MKTKAVQSMIATISLMALFLASTTLTSANNFLGTKYMPLRFINNSGTLTGPFTIPQADTKVFSFTLVNNKTSPISVNSITSTLTTNCTNAMAPYQSCSFFYPQFSCRLVSTDANPVTYAETMAPSGFSIGQSENKIQFDTTLSGGATPLIMQSNTTKTIDMMCDLSQFNNPPAKAVKLTVSFGIKNLTDITYTYMRGFFNRTLGLVAPVFGPTFLN